MNFFSSMHTGKTASSSRVPPLFAETSEGEESIPEADLYRYTRYRWLINERDELAKRYLKFSLPHLVESAVGICQGAVCCTKVLKLTEGLHNKVFVLSMDNGMEVVAKLPNPNAGPAGYMTASEVATRKMLRDVYSIPVPRVLSWSCDASNPVQAEYILEEKAPGVRLGPLWSSLPGKIKRDIMAQVADLDCSLTAVQFKKHGCLYFKEDLRRLTGTADDMEFTADQQSLTLDEYAMGPLTKAELWDSGRKEMDFDRGPWQDHQTYAQALGSNETAWIQRYAKPRMNYFASLEEPEQPNEALELLAKYQRVAPFLVASTNKTTAENMLWHPDLHRNNIFVDPTSHKITAIIDWQSAEAAPLFYQSGIHKAFRHNKSVGERWQIPQKPDDFDDLSPAEQTRIEQEIESETFHKYYEYLTLKRVPRHWEYLQQPLVPILRKPVSLVTGVWEKSELFYLRDSLINLSRRWTDIFGEDAQCPITFSAEELKRHAHEEGNVDGITSILTMFQDEGALPADGMVDHENYPQAVENCRLFKQVFVDSATNQHERDLHERLWPYTVPDED